jgi:DNA-binding beta-propeller fold protein YncE
VSKLRISPALGVARAAPSLKNQERRVDGMRCSLAARHASPRLWPVSIQDDPDMPLLNSPLTVRRTLSSGLLTCLALALLLLGAGTAAADLPAASAGFEPESFVNFETPQVHPIDLTPSGDRLLVVNTAAATLMVFDVTGVRPVLVESIPVGVDPVSVRARNEGEAWVVNLVSDSLSIVDLAAGIVVDTVQTADEPADVIFAGTPERAFVTASQANLLQVFDPNSLGAAPTDVTILGEDPRALAKSADGQTVYVAVFESGNGTTLMPGGKNIDNRIRDAAGASEGPWGGISPPPNDGALFDPPQNPSNPSPPEVGVIVRKNDAGQWMDDNGGDWTALTSGAFSDRSDRIAGWDLPDRDVAIVDANSLAVRYQLRLMNMVMALDVNPVTGDVFAVGTEATNEIRFEPKLQGTFVRVHMASFDPASAPAPATFVDLNPHIDYSTPRSTQRRRNRSIGDPRAIAWNASGTLAYVAGMGSNDFTAVDASGARAGRINVGEGPTGIALDDARGLAFVLNRFDASISTVDLSRPQELSRTPFFDPTPPAIRAGRVHLYGTHEGSGHGQIACASCHVDSRSDRLSWDLGNPAGEMETRNGFDFHPMKGPLKTQSLQDIIGAPALHHRGDRDDLFAFAGAFEGLQGDDAPLDETSMAEFEDFLDTVHFPPNPNRNIDNTLSTAVPIPGAGGTVRGFGDAVAGLDSYLTGNGTSSTCGNCHLGPRSRSDIRSVSGSFIAGQPLVAETFSGFYDRIGLFWNSTDGSTAGFGFRPDGAQSSEMQHRNRSFPLMTESGTHVFAFLLSIEGPLPEISGFGRDAHAGVGQQVTIGPGASGADMARRNTLVAIAESGDVGLAVQGELAGEKRGLAYLGGGVFQSDRLDDRFTTAELDAATGGGNVLTYTLVPRGVEYRQGLDQELDGRLDRDELDNGTSPEDAAALWELCADEGATCRLAERAVVRYGSDEGFVYGVFEGDVGCTTGLMGDPAHVDPARCEARRGTLVCAQTSAIGSILPANYQLGTLAAGETVYVDRSYTYTSVPAALDGVPVVMTANDDKQAAIELRIQLSEPRTLYVGWDDRISPLPAWLQSWTSEPGMSIVNTDTTMSVFSMDFPAGEVVLGGTGAAGGSISMYVVAIDESSSGACDPIALPEPHPLVGLASVIALLALLHRARSRRGYS